MTPDRKNYLTALDLRIRDTRITRLSNEVQAKREAEKLLKYVRR